MFNFIVDIYASIPAGTQPDLSQPPLAHYEVGGNANETLAEVLGGVQTYDYHYALSAPFQAAAGPSTGSRSKPIRAALPTGGCRKPVGGTGIISEGFRAMASITSLPPAMQLLRWSAQTSGRQRCATL